MSDEPVQLFVRTDKGATFGPLSPTSVELLLDQGIVTGRVQVSLDGLNYVFPGRMPGVRMIFPRTLWGEVVEPGEALDAAWSQVTLPPNPNVAPVPVSSPSRVGGVPSSSASGIRAGPGAAAAAAGPSARPQAAQQRPAQPPGSRPSGVMRAAPVVSSPSGIAPSIAPAMMPTPVMMAAPVGPVELAPTPTPIESDWAELTTDPGEHPADDGGAAFATDHIQSNGALAVTGPIRLYFLAAATDRTGLLTLNLGDRVIQIHFRKGTPEFVDSNHPEDGLALFLVKRQLLTAEVISQAESQRGRFGGELLPTLFALGLLNPNTVFAHLSQRAADLVYRGLFAEQGTFTWQNIELSPTKAMPMGHKWSILMEQLRRVPSTDVRRRMMSALDFPVMKGQGPVATTDLKLSPQETRALTHFDGVRSLNQLMTQMPADAEVMLRTAWVLQFCDVVAFAAAVLKNDAPRPVVQTPARPIMQTPAVPQQSAPPPVMKPPTLAPSPAGAPGNPQSIARSQTVTYPGTKPKPPPSLQPVPVAAAAVVGPLPVGPPKISPTISSPSGIASRPSQIIQAPVTAAAEVKLLTDLLATLRTQNHFEVLGVAKEADPSQIKIAYFKLAKVYHPDTVPAGTPEAIAKLKADIFARVGDAHRALSDPKTKADYIAELAVGGTGEKVDISKILAAEEFFQKGMILVKARKFPEAVKMLTDAIAASDIEGEYYAWRGWAKFFLYPDKTEGQAEAMKDIAICLKKNPNVAAVYYFQGFMAKVLGDLKTAKVHFNKTVQLDPRHIDAQRELRMMK